MKKGMLMAFNGTGKPLEIKEYPVTPLLPGEILVKNLYTTLCGSDIHTYCGVRKEICPTVLGHEIVGKILEIENTHSHLDYSGDELKKGDIITWSIFSSDPGSANALRGIPQKGSNLFKYGHALIKEDNHFHGGLSDYCILRSNTGILKIPAAIPLQVAAPLNCAFATVAGALRMAETIKNKNVLVFGMGMLGISCAAMCKEAGATWVGAVDISDKRLKEALPFGVDEVFKMQNGGRTALAEDINSKSPGKDIDIVFDMSGSPDAMEAGIDMLGIGGYAVWIGAVFNNRKVQIDAEKVVRNLISIRGLHNYNFDDFQYALDFLKRNWNKYPFNKTVEKEFELEDAEEAFRYAVANQPLRVGIRIK